MRRRFLAGVLAAALSAAVAPAMSHAADAPLIVGTDVSFMPFEFTHDGKTQGFDIDLWAAIAKGLGIEYKLQPMDFSGLIPALQTRNIDLVISGMTIKPSRAQVIDFSTPYYSSGLAAVVPAKDTSIKTPADLAGKMIGVKTGTTSVDYVKKNLKGAQTLSFPNIDNAFLAMQAGRVDAVVFDTPVVTYYANTAGKGLVRLVQPPMTSGEYYGIGFPKGSPLVARVDGEITKLVADGTYKSIYMKWFGVAPDFQPK